MKYFIFEKKETFSGLVLPNDAFFTKKKLSYEITYMNWLFNYFICHMSMGIVALIFFWNPQKQPKMPCIYIMYI